MLAASIGSSDKTNMFTHPIVDARKTMYYVSNDE